MITPEDAVSHIVNSLDNENANIWTDPMSGETWVVRSGYRNGTIEITISNEDGDESDFLFKLTPVHV